VVLALLAIGAAGCSGAATAGTHSSLATTPAASSSSVSHAAPSASASASVPDTELSVSKLCLLTTKQVAELAPQVASNQVSYSTKYGPTCNYGLVGQNGSMTQWVAIEVLTNAEWSVGPTLTNHVNSVVGFSDGVVGIVQTSSPKLTLVEAGAQMSDGSWLYLEVGNSANSAPLATIPAITVALIQAEEQYAHPNPGTSSVSTGGLSGEPNTDACKLLTAAEITTFDSGYAPNTWSSPTVKDSDGTQHFSCVWAYWLDGNVGQGNAPGAGYIELSCGPGAAESSMSDTTNGRYFQNGATPVAIVLSQFTSHVDPASALNRAEATAKSLNVC
jgi:hypothetical protein